MCKQFPALAELTGYPRHEPFCPRPLDDAQLLALIASLRREEHRHLLRHALLELLGDGLEERFESWLQQRLFGAFYQLLVSRDGLALRDMLIKLLGPDIESIILANRKGRRK